MFGLLLLQWGTLSLAHPHSYPTRVEVNPCGFPYPINGQGSARMWRYQPVRTLSWRISTIIQHIHYQQELNEFSLSEHTWIPDESSMDNIVDVAAGLPSINRSLKYYSVAFDILEPHYSGRISHGCREAVRHFNLLYTNHTMLVCETDEAMRMFGVTPTLDYPTLEVNVSKAWADLDPKDCTFNGVYSVTVVKKYKQFLEKFEKLLKTLVDNMSKV